MPKQPNRRETKKNKNEGEAEQEISVEDTSSASSQVRIDNFFKTTDSSSDLAQVLQSFHEKLDNVASQEYLENKFKQAEEVLTDKLLAVKSEISEQIQKEVQHIHREIAGIKDTVKKLEDKTAEMGGKLFDIENTVDRVDRKCGKLEEENKELKVQVAGLEHALKVNSSDTNNLEQYTRRNSIRIYGLDDPEKKETTDATTERVLKVLNNDLGMKIQPRDIDIAHRLGTYLEEGNRPVICKFVARSQKMQAISLRRKLKGKPVVIRDDLTLKNAKLLEKVSQSVNVKSAWTSGGKIFACLLNDKVVTVTQLTNLDVALVVDEPTEPTSPKTNNT